MGPSFDHGERLGLLAALVHRLVRWYDGWLKAEWGLPLNDDTGWLAHRAKPAAGRLDSQSRFLRGACDVASDNRTSFL